MGVKVIGTTSVVEQSGSPRYSYSKEGLSIQRIYRGDMAELKEMRPTVGHNASDGVKVISVEIYPTSVSEIGEMVVKYDDFTSVSNEVEVGTEVLSDEIELEWSQLEKPLASAPIFKNVPFSEIQIVEKIISGESNNSEIDKCCDDAKKYYEKRQKGVSSYLIFAPVVRRTRQTRAKPSAGACGKISPPPMTVGNYVFLKTADRVLKSNSDKFWTRTEEWTGADNWDRDLYK
ncbi:MAG: hypothetical protein E7035_01640 [Verrucomicrobiaceae bacterium]|nr:hypothetical protein [Verrucomicrobiaceae bacterium]